MSFVLHVIDAPGVCDLQQAVDFVHGSALAEGPALAAPNPALIRFVCEITRLYPVLDDPDGDDPACVWPEGFALRGLATRRLNVGIKTSAVRPQLLNEVAIAALGAGLQVLDPQHGEVYRLDGAVCRASGPVRLVSGSPWPAAPAADTPWSSRDYPSQEFLRARFCERFASDGFTPTAAGGASLRAARRVGETRQSMIFSAGLTPPLRRLNLTLGVSVGRVSALWKELLGGRVQAMLWPHAGLCEVDFEIACGELHADGAGPVEHPLQSEARSEGEFAAWSERVSDWYCGGGNARMDALGGLRALGRVVLSDSRLERAGRIRQSPASIMTTLCLARAVQPDRLDAWVDAFWTQFRAEPGAGWGPLLHDPEATALTRLVDHLRSPACRFDASAPTWHWPDRLPLA